MHTLIFSTTFTRKLDKLAQKDGTVRSKVKEILYALARNPFFPSLGSHKVDTRIYGKRWSSRVSGDIRIIWDFDRGNFRVVYLFTIGRHSGNDRVYK